MICCRKDCTNETDSIHSTTIRVSGKIYTRYICKPCRNERHAQRLKRKLDIPKKSWLIKANKSYMELSKKYAR